MLPLSLPLGPLAQNFGVHIVKGMQNISGEQNANPELRNGDVATLSSDPVSLRKALIEEMTAWSSRDRGGVFKTWHRLALSLVHLNVLTALEAEGPLSMTRLAQVMDVSDASTTGIIDRMEKRGLVERRHDTTDRRKVLVYPTDAGIELFRAMAQHRRDMLARVLEELDEAEMSHLLIGFRAISAARHKVMEREMAGLDASRTETPNDEVS